MRTSAGDLLRSAGPEPWVQEGSRERLRRAAARPLSTDSGAVLVGTGRRLAGTAGGVPVTAVAVPVSLAEGGRGLVVGLAARRGSALQGYVEGLTSGDTGQGSVVDGRGPVVAGAEPALVGRRLAAPLLYDRRGCFGLAEAELARAARQDRERVLLFVDLDGPMQVNDVLGHHEGAG